MDTTEYNKQQTKPIRSKHRTGEQNVATGQ